MWENGKWERERERERESLPPPPPNNNNNKWMSYLALMTFLTYRTKPCNKSERNVRTVKGHIPWENLGWPMNFTVEPLIYKQKTLLNGCESLSGNSRLIYIELNYLYPLTYFLKTTNQTKTLELTHKTSAIVIIRYRHSLTVLLPLNKTVEG